jgi:hypothetical protein
MKNLRKKLLGLLNFWTLAIIWYSREHGFGDWVYFCLQVKGWMNLAHQVHYTILTLIIINQKWV